MNHSQAEANAVAWAEAYHATVFAGEIPTLRAFLILKATEWQRAKDAELCNSVVEPPEAKGRVMSEMFWRGAFAARDAIRGQSDE